MDSLWTVDHAIVQNQINQGDAIYLGPPHPVEDSKKLPSVAEVVNESAEKTGCIIPDEQKSAFDATWKSRLIETFERGGFKTELDEFLNTSKSNGRKLQLQILVLPPDKYFKIHAHPTIEFELTLYGSLHEYRWITMCMPVSDLQVETPEGPEIQAKFPFDHRFVPQGQTMVNEIGSVHQSFTSKDIGCAIVLLWSGCHANTHPSRVFNTDPRIRPRAGWD